MYTDLVLTIDVSQREKIKEKTHFGEMRTWIANAVSDLIEQDTRSRLEPSHFQYEGRNTPLKGVKCFFKLEEIERLKSIVSRIKNERSKFSRTGFVSEAIRRKLYEEAYKKTPLDSTSEHVYLRVRAEVRSWIRKICRERKNSRSCLLVDWLIESVEEFLDAQLPIGVKDPYEKTKDTVKMTVKVPCEFSKKIKDIVSESKKTYPAFSVSSFLSEVARRKFENEMGS